MDIITNLLPINKTRAQLYLNEEKICSVELKKFQKFFHIGDEINLEILEKYQLENEKDIAFEIVLKKLDYRALTEFEIIKLLRLKGFFNSVITYVIEKLKNYGFVNDLKYAKNFIDFYKNKYGKLKIEFLLKNKGIDKNIIEQSFLEQSFDNKSIIENIINKKLKNGKDMKKIIQYCIAKGFLYNEIYSVIKNLDEID